MDRPIQFGPYLLLEKLGEGTQGDVHLARGLHEGEVVVVKRLHPYRASDTDFVRRFRHEAVVATSVESRHVIEVLDAGQVEDRLYIAMEYVPGWPLSSILKDLRRAKQQVSLSSAADLVVGALEGLHALHTARGPDGDQLGIVHRDVAPKNLMLAEDGCVKVIDLGLGKSKRQDWATASGIVMGTPGYLSPEQATAHSVDHRADLFAMGIVFFELLTLQRYMPVRPLAQMLVATLQSHYRPPSSIRSDVPPALDEIVRCAVEIDPARRFASAREFADAVAQVIPVRPEESARTLVSEIAWGEVTKSYEAVKRLVAREVELDDAEESKRIVFSARGLEPHRTAVTQLAPPPPARRRFRPALVVLGALVVGTIGWFARGWVDAQPAPVVTEAPRAIPTPPVKVVPAMTIDEPEVKAARVRRPRPEPVKLEPKPDPSPTPVRAPADLREEVTQLARAAVALAKRVPEAEREQAKALATKLNRLQSLPSLDGQEANVRALRVELDALSASSQ